MTRKVFLFMIRFYQAARRAVLPVPRCRFTPTCSEYTFQAVEKYGIITGCFLGIKRISRCHPFHEGGYDPLR